MMFDDIFLTEEQPLEMTLEKEEKIVNGVLKDIDIIEEKDNLIKELKGKIRSLKLEVKQLKEQVEIGEMSSIDIEVGNYIIHIPSGIRIEDVSE